MVDLIMVVVLLLVIGGATIYIVKAKKNGVKCIGCPMAGSCARTHPCNGERGYGGSGDVD